MLEEQDRLKFYRNRPVVSEGGHEKLTPGVDLNLHNFPDRVDDNEDRDVGGVMDGELAHRVGVRQVLLYLQTGVAARSGGFRQASPKLLR